MAQQTAVNFLYQFVQLKLTHEQQIQYEGLFQQAKQIEKQQIINAFDIACEDEDRIGKEYYYDTYGGQGSPDTSPNTKNK